MNFIDQAAYICLADHKSWSVKGAAEPWRCLGSTLGEALNEVALNPGMFLQQFLSLSCLFGWKCNRLSLIKELNFRALWVFCAAI